MRKEEPEFTYAEQRALETMEPIAHALTTAIDSIHEAAYQRAEAKYWRELYGSHLDASIKHGEAMIGNVLMALITKATPRDH